MEVCECEEAVENALRKDRPRMLVDAINKYLKIQKQSKQSTKDSTSEIAFTCIECSENGAEGRARAFFSAPPPTVVFCANRLYSENEVEEAMVHELVHAYDFTVREMDITKSEVLACSEIRAARESECYRKAQLLAQLLPNVDFFHQGASMVTRKCVREHAIRSTSSMFPNKAERDVDQVFDKCYFDRSPFASSSSKPEDDE